MKSFYDAALADLAAVLERIDDAAVESSLELIAESSPLALYGVGREGLQIKGLAMRLYHLGLNASVVGDMACPPLTGGGLLIVSAGPGHFSTVEALMRVARQGGAKTLLFTAQPQAACAALADAVVTVPAQTMADDRVANVSVLPMGSLYEGALYLLFEAMVLRLRDRLHVEASAMRARHTNLE
jgi:6-phospho-3-hexuloisomerase